MSGVLTPLPSGYFRLTIGDVVHDEITLEAARRILEQRDGR